MTTKKGTIQNQEDGEIFYAIFLIAILSIAGLLSFFGLEFFNYLFGGL